MSIVCSSPVEKKKFCWESTSDPEWASIIIVTITTSLNLGVSFLYRTLERAFIKLWLWCL